jgi:hypothetical protein
MKANQLATSSIMDPTPGSRSTPDTKEDEEVINYTKTQAPTYLEKKKIEERDVGRHSSSVKTKAATPMSTPIVSPPANNQASASNVDETPASGGVLASQLEEKMTALGESPDAKCWYFSFMFGNQPPKELGW